MNFKQQFQQKQNVVNDWLLKLAPQGDNAQKNIYESANYSVSAGGKRIRPVIAYFVCEMLGGNIDDVIHFASAIEFIHTYSLIHDDLPCMDNDDLRRGMPTSHKKFGEAIAVLTGDMLLTYAFETIANSTANPSLIAKALKIISNASGAQGMLGGQVIDIKGVSTCNELINMYNLKTGQLLMASALVGALVGGANSNETQRISDFAQNLGIAFQIKDDILDVIGDEQTLGKPIGSDKDCGKKTFVDFLGVDGAKSALDDYTNKAKNQLDIFGVKATFLLELADYLIKRES